MRSSLVKIYHSFSDGRKKFVDFLSDLQKLLGKRRVIFGLHSRGGEFFYTVCIDESFSSAFGSAFYSYFDNFQIDAATKNSLDFDPNRTLIGELDLKNRHYFPFSLDPADNVDIINNLFRTFESGNMATDKIAYFVDIAPIHNETAGFFWKSKIAFLWFRIRLFFSSWKYVFNVKGENNWKKEGQDFYMKKIKHELFDVRIFFVVESSNKIEARGILEQIFTKFSVFRNYPLNEFELDIRDFRESHARDFLQKRTYGKSLMLSIGELSEIFSFPKNPKNENLLLKVNSKKLALSIGVPTFPFERLTNGEIQSQNTTKNINILGISDYKSTNVSVGIYDEDRLRHIYTIGKTGVGKSKFLISTIVNDIRNGNGLAIIDPHGDLIEEAMNHIPKERLADVIIFDPTDEDFPFCINPLQVEQNESKQILAKGFIDIFKKFFGANWNAKLEHVLRMVFLALLDKKDATLFDIVRALTDKDFRYEMIEEIRDDVVKNFWTNEFAGWSQQFNNEAIMPILNKVGQILSIEVLKNIFTSRENKLDFRRVMDEKKILLIKLPKGKLQEEIMGFLGAMFVTKIYQAAMGRQGVDKDKRTPFFLYVDEFQNFATDTFSEILSEARKYGLALIVAHQFIRQIPENLSRALFGNVGTIVSFRISSEDSLVMRDHFSPFLDAYDLANLSERHFYIKTLVHGATKDPFSLVSLPIPDKNIDSKIISELYDLTRKNYCRSLLDAKKTLKQESDVIEQIETFVEPLL